ncbi:hypothetical protein [Escherichia coli]|nr:hypothetical protein [Escherichia coli]
MEEFKLLLRQYKDKFDLLEAGELELEELEIFLDYCMNEFRTMMKRS